MTPFCALTAPHVSSDELSRSSPSRVESGGVWIFTDESSGKHGGEFPEREVNYSYRTPHLQKYLAKLTGLSQNAVHRAVARGNLDPGSMESIFIWLSRNAKPEHKRKMLRHALYEDAYPAERKPRKKSAEEMRDVATTSR